MLEKGIILKCPTEYVNSLEIQEKKDGTIRLCLDARLINSRMKKGIHQTPIIMMSV